MNIPAETRNPRWSIVDKLGLFLAFVAVVLTIGNRALKNIDGWVNPVVGLLEITDIRRHPTEPESVMIAGNAEKFRNCDWLGIEWFVGKVDGRSASVPARFDDKPQVRATGVMHWSELVVSLPEDVVCNSSYAFVVHNCHPLWLTRSLFYDSNSYNVACS